MPRVDDITARVLSGRDVIEGGGRFWFAQDATHRGPDLVHSRVGEVVEFARRLEQLCDSYWAEQKPFERDTNYEDIAYVARQLDDSLWSEYENPALLPLIELLSDERNCSSDSVRDLASLTVEYIEDVVCAMLDVPIGPVDQLTAITDAFADKSVDSVTVATLNHDLVLERALAEAGVKYADGFGLDHGTLRVWNDRFEPPDRSLLKLHGSIDWWRYELDLGDFEGQFTAKATDGDPQHPRGPGGELLRHPVVIRPLILTGTFNKILQYGSGIYADQHARFHNALRDADALVVIGYGFRDKAINSRIVAWAERPGKRRMVVVHPDPQSFADNARGAIRSKWARWQNRDLLAFLPEYLTPATTWESLAALLAK